MIGRYGITATVRLTVTLFAKDYEGLTLEAAKKKLKADVEFQHDVTVDDREIDHVARLAIEQLHRDRGAKMNNYTYEFFGSGSAVLSIDPTEFTCMSVEAIKTELKCLAQSQVPELNFPDVQFDNAALEVYYASLKDLP